jgi:hypothetical protein
MAIDSTTAIRRGMVALQKDNADLITMVATRDIYGQTVKADHGWPFVRSGAPNSVPIRASCVDGGEWTIAMHAFAKDRLTGKKAVETAEDYAARVGAAVAAALDTQVIILPRGRAVIRWTGSQLLMDPEEPGCFHSIQNFVVRALTA